MALSVIERPRMKALCVSEMIEGIIVLNLLAIALAIILYITLHKEIGLKSEILSGDLNLGTRTIEVEFNPGGIMPLFKLNK